MTSLELLPSPMPVCRGVCSVPSGLWRAATCSCGSDPAPPQGGRGQRVVRVLRASLWPADQRVALTMVRFRPQLPHPAPLRPASPA